MTSRALPTIYCLIIVGSGSACSSSKPAKDSEHEPTHSIESPLNSTATARAGATPDVELFSPDERKSLEDAIEKNRKRIADLLAKDRESADSSEKRWLARIEEFNKALVKASESISQAKADLLKSTETVQKAALAHEEAMTKFRQTGHDEAKAAAAKTQALLEDSIKKARERLEAIEKELKDDQKEAIKEAKEAAKMAAAAAL